MGDPRRQDARMTDGIVSRRIGIAVALLGVAAVGVTAMLLSPWLGPGSLALLFILPVMIAAARGGLVAGLVAAGGGAVAFNFFVIEPRFTLRIADPDNVATTLVLLLVAGAVSQLAGRLRAAREAAEALAADQRRLAMLERAMTDAGDQGAALALLIDAVTTAFAVDAAALGEPDIAGAAPLDRAAGEWALANGEPAGRGSGVIDSADRLYWPVVAGGERVALIALSRVDGAPPVPAGRRALIRGMIAAAAQTIGRLRLAEQQAAIREERRRSELSAALLSSVGHDLRTPLTVILGEGRALAGGGTIVAEAQRLARRIDNLLGMARVEGGAVAVAIEPVDLTDAVASVLDDAAGMLAGRDVTVTIAPDAPLVQADPGLLHHVLLNLIDNAAKFSGGPIAIVVEGAVLTVSDAGPGIPAGHEDDVFTRFRRFAGSDRDGGSGLGLAIVRAFSQAFGARVTAANRPGGGAIFTVGFRIA